MTAEADRILDAMLRRQRDGVFPNGGGFQNGIIDRYPDGAEFFTWDGKTAGYEGHLVYSWTWLHALFVRRGVRSQGAQAAGMKWDRGSSIPGHAQKRFELLQSVRRRSDCFPKPSTAPACTACC